LGPAARGRQQAPTPHTVVAAANGGPRCCAARRCGAGPPSARHRLAVHGQARHLRRGAGICLLSADETLAHDSGRRLLDDLSPYRALPRSPALAENSRLAGVLAPAHRRRASVTAGRLDGGRSEAPRSLGKQASANGDLVAAALSRARFTPAAESFSRE